jgi:hypothetical protein
MRFWLYDLEFDYHPLFDRYWFKVAQTSSYGLMMVYTAIYIIFYQKDNRYSNSYNFIKWAGIVILGIFCILTIMLVIL